MSFDTHDVFLRCFHIAFQNSCFFVDRVYLILRSNVNAIHGGLQHSHICFEYGYVRCESIKPLFHMFKAAGEPLFHMFKAAGDHTRQCIDRYFFSFFFVCHM